MNNQEIARVIIDTEWMKSISPMNPYVLEQKIIEALEAKDSEHQKALAEQSALLDEIAKVLEKIVYAKNMTDATGYILTAEQILTKYNSYKSTLARQKVKRIL